MRVPVRALPSPHPQRESEDQERWGKIEHRKMDKALVLRNILPMSGVGEESRVCQNRRYGGLPMRRMVKEKGPGNSRERHYHLG